MVVLNTRYDPKELDVTSYSLSRLEASVLKRVRDYIASEKLFQHLPKGISDDDLTRLVDDILFLKKILVVEGCRHQCTFCFYSPSNNVREMYFDDYQYLVSRLEEMVQVTGIPMFYTPSEFAFHRNGESIMYVGKRSPIDERKGDLPDIILRLKESSLLNRTDATRNILFIYTAGFYDVDPEKTISSNVLRLVEDPAKYFGSSNGKKGGIVFSLHTAPRYFRNNSVNRGITKNEWIDILVEDFRILRPLYEDDRLTVRTKVVEDTPKNQRMLNNHHPSYVLELLAHILDKARYGRIESAVANHPSFLSIDKACNLGGGKKFERMPSYVDIHQQEIMSVASITELRKGNPSVYISVDGKLVRVIPKLLRDMFDQWVIRETQLSLPSQWS